MDNQSEHTNKHLLAKPSYMAALRLAMPVILLNCTFAGMQATDAWVLGKIGSTELAAMTLPSMSIFVIVSFAYSFLGIVTALVGQNYGAGKLQLCGHYAWLGIIFAIFVGTLSIALWPIGSIFEFISGNTPQSLGNLESRYFKISLLALPGVLATNAIANYYLGIKKPTIVLLCSLIGLFLNVIITYGLVFGKGPLPEIGFDGATYRAMQFDGQGASELSMDDRMTVANMAIEAGGKNGIFEYDEKTKSLVEERTSLNGTKSEYEPVERDDNESFIYDSTVDLSQLEPTVACHPDPGNRKLAREMTDMKLDRAYIGSCTGGKTSDFIAFAEIVKGQEVRIDTFGVPATPEIVNDLQTTEWDGKSVWNILSDAGVRMTENAGCSACLGGPVDTFGRMNEGGMKCISATNRNFPGRMGSKESQVYLASPATVAASALAGHVADPRDYLS